jgi:hypothetical protein
MEKAAAEDASRLAEELGSTLRRVLSESAQIAHCLSRMRAEGFEVSVVLEATLGFARAEPVEGAPQRPFDVRVERPEPAPLRMTPLDKKFLRSLKITVDEEGE